MSTNPKKKKVPAVEKEVASIPVDKEFASIPKLDVVTALPFDLNSIFSLNYSFDVLKQALDFLLAGQSA